MNHTPAQSSLISRTRATGSMLLLDAGLRGQPPTDLWPAVQQNTVVFVVESERSLGSLSVSPLPAGGCKVPPQRSGFLHSDLHESAWPVWGAESATRSCARIAVPHSVGQQSGRKIRSGILHPKPATRTLVFLRTEANKKQSKSCKCI